jgi:hypothetical protein
MLQFNAYAFIELMRVLKELEQLLSDDARDLESSRVRDDPRKREALLERIVSTKPQLEGLAAQLLEQLEDRCERLQLGLAVQKINRMRKVEPILNPDSIGSLRELRERVLDELRSRVFMFIPPERAKFFNDPAAAFGDAVRDRFAGLIADIEGAARCLGCGLSTAAVFHLMRVMEAGVRRLAHRLKVPRNQIRRRTWGEILREINSAVAALPSNTPNETARKERFEEIAAHLRHVKNAWRNPVMHPERLYSQEEAETVFDSVRAFINELTRRHR